MTGDRAVVWSRSDRPARLFVEWSTRESFADARRVPGEAALEADGLTARLDLEGLPPGQRIVYRVLFQDLRDPRAWSLPVQGSFRTPPAGPADVRLAFSADTCGQGWGIDEARGGLAHLRVDARRAARTSSCTWGTRSTRTTPSRPRSCSTTAACGATS